MRLKPTRAMPANAKVSGRSLTPAPAGLAVRRRRRCGPRPGAGSATGGPLARSAVGRPRPRTTSGSSAMRRDTGSTGGPLSGPGASGRLASTAPWSSTRSPAPGRRLAGPAAGRQPADEDAVVRRVLDAVGVTYGRSCRHRRLRRHHQVQHPRPVPGGVGAAWRSRATRRSSPRWPAPTGATRAWDWRGSWVTPDQRRRPAPGVRHRHRLRLPQPRHRRLRPRSCSTRCWPSTGRGSSGRGQREDPAAGPVHGPLRPRPRLGRATTSTARASRRWPTWPPATTTRWSS